MSLEQPNVSKSKKNKPKENGIESIFNIKIQMFKQLQDQPVSFQKKFYPGLGP